ncbi:DNA polymerase IV [Paenibacillus konkukensis]|uniref:DNA polymerase IV n=1 Tax=Paenibacillus konkukensis TaxID=2020716 RepID=A0ABY4RJF5_9BACL|nr:DNA polymerase IV [Paenibacillus konkukensis]UQZ81644.1 DNA polymerase IV [Paenibacillus konkukensis]
MRRVIMLADGQSFYASVEKAAHPEYRDKPVAVGDPARKSGIILAACPIAKARGVTTAERVGEAQAKCPDLVVIRPRMATYIAVSLLITEIYESFTDQVEPYSIDEQFLDVTGSIALFGTAEEIARQIQTRVHLSTGVWSRVGIGPTKILAKMATDNFAKKRLEGIYTLSNDNIESDLWPLPVYRMFMVASRMSGHFMRMGIRTIGDIARLDLGEFKQRLRYRMGRQSDIQAEYYWQTARGIDPSPVVAGMRSQVKVINNGRALKWNLYKTIEDIEPLMIELVIEVCRRARKYGYMGRVIGVGAAETDGSRSFHFGRQMSLMRPTYLEHEVGSAVKKLFLEHWQGMPLTQLHITLTGLSGDETYQLDLFEDREKLIRCAKTIDAIKDRFGLTAMIRASSLQKTAQAFERAAQIGGHWA